MDFPTFSVSWLSIESLVIWGYRGGTAARSDRLDTPKGDLMALTELQIRKATPKQQQYKLYDAGGLLLVVRPTRGKFWRLKYRYGRKERSLSLGE